MNDDYIDNIKAELSTINSTKIYVDRMFSDRKSQLLLNVIHNTENVLAKRNSVVMSHFTDFVAENAIKNVDEDVELENGWSYKSSKTTKTSPYITKNDLIIFLSDDLKSVKMVDVGFQTLLRDAEVFGDKENVSEEVLNRRTYNVNVYLYGNLGICTLKKEDGTVIDTKNSPIIPPTDKIDDTLSDILNWIKLGNKKFSEIMAENYAESSKDAVENKN